MRGRIRVERLAVRLLNPSVNAPITRFYKANEIIKITDAVEGDTYEGDNVWYKLEDETYVWSGAVETTSDFEDADEYDKHQFLISYRQCFKDGRINMDSKIPPNELYFAPVKLPTYADNIKVNNLRPEAFANAVAQSVEKAGNDRNHVFVYIHGYQIFSSLKLDLFTSFVHNYMGQSRKIAKVIFMVWPAQGLSRKRADDRAIFAGKNFTKYNLFETFIELSKALQNIKSKNCYLNLIVHSFGHQLLNGMINPGPKRKEKIFENIFLMAPDVTHLAVKKGGVELDNYRDTQNRICYNYNGLMELGRNIHVYHNDQDFLLYSSTKKFVPKENRDDHTITDKYRNLGNFGEKMIDPKEVEMCINFINIEDVLKGAVESDKKFTLNFPFRPMPARTKEIIKTVRERKCYNIVTDLDIMFHAARYPNHHRYLFTCKPVVKHIIGLLKEGSLPIEK